MADDLITSLAISGAGLKVQGTRLRVIAENIANANSLATEPGQLPYRRQVVTFENVLSRETGHNMVEIDEIRPDLSDFGKSFDPSHPAADENGYVQTPNVNTLIEMMDMREAQRSYEANLNVIKSAKAMLASTIDILSPQ